MIATVHSSGENIMTALIFIGVMAAIAISSLGQRRAGRNRSVELDDLSRRLGFEDFNPARDDDFTMGWGFLRPLAQGEDRYAFNILRGTYQNQTLFVFDYLYRTGSGKNQKTHKLTMLMLVCKEAFPWVSIGPENLRSKIAAALGLGDEVGFESAEFSRMFCVHARDKKFAYDICHPQMIEYLMANRDLQVEIQGPAVMLVFEPQLSAGRIEFNLQRLAQIRSLMPEYLFTQTT